MSGIAGIVHLSGPPPLRDEARQLSAGVAHRGRDDKGWFSEGPAALAHRRFAVRPSEPTDPREGPRRVVLQDARLYDGPEDALEQAFAGDPVEGLRRVPGDFAVAAWDRRDHVLHLARDPLGTRPLYWTRSGDRIAFCSEIPPLLGLPWVSRDLDLDQLSEYLSFRYVHAPRTLLRDVRALPPGHLLRVDTHGARAERWYRPRYVAPGAPLPDPYRRLFRLWFLFGIPGFGGTVAILWLMVAKPAVWP